MAIDLFLEANREAILRICRQHGARNNVFRNVIVHNYLGITLARGLEVVYQHLSTPKRRAGPILGNLEAPQ